jgi:hypothetical protein
MHQGTYFNQFSGAHRGRNIIFFCVAEPEPRAEIMEPAERLRLLSIYQSLEEILLKKIMVAKEFSEIITILILFGYNMHQSL